MKPKHPKGQATSTDSKLQLSLTSVPVDGALGLLAYGDIGLAAWRRKRELVEGTNWRKKLAEELASEDANLKDREGNGTGDTKE